MNVALRSASFFSLIFSRSSRNVGSSYRRHSLVKKPEIAVYVIRDRRYVHYFLSKNFSGAAGLEYLSAEECTTDLIQRRREKGTMHSFRLDLFLTEPWKISSERRLSSFH